MNMQENPNPQEKKEMKISQGNLFEVPGVPISDCKEETGTKSEETIEEKKIGRDMTLLERKESKDSDFKAPEELETDYTEKSWTKPEKSMEEKSAERTEEIRQEVVEETKEREISEAREREAREREAREREAREREAREGKYTVYTMEKRLTKSGTERKLFGVCGGLGEYFGIDPTLVRLAFVILTLFDGIGLVLYIILAVIMPSEKNVKMVPSYRK
jgi:phage shock protein C